MAIARAGSTLFWHHTTNKPIESAGEMKVHPAQLSALLLLIVSSPALVIFAGPLTDYAFATATSLHDFGANVSAVLEGDQ
jgi:multicomponent K+:H+ antiporter subunit D